MLIIFDSVLFLFIGYFFGRQTTNPKTLQEAVKQVKRYIHPPKSGIIDYPSQEDIDYRESGEELIDKERERVFREQFK